MLDPAEFRDLAVAEVGEFAQGDLARFLSGFGSALSFRGNLHQPVGFADSGKPLGFPTGEHQRGIFAARQIQRFSAMIDLFDDFLRDD